MSKVGVLGGRGKTGRAVRAALATAGHQTVPVGSAECADLVAALRGCQAVYVMAPNLLADEPAYVTHAVAAARCAGVARVVYHSVAAPYTPAMPHHLGKAVAEDLVRRSGLAWTILQPCAYVQNFVPALHEAQPVLRVPYDPAAPFGLVDLADVGVAAAAVLDDGRHVGATYELGGPGLVTVEQVARTASEVLDRTVPIERISPGEWATTDGAGLDPRERDWLTAMFSYYDAHGLPTGGVPLTALLGRPPTCLRDALARELS